MTAPGQRQEPATASGSVVGEEPLPRWALVGAGLALLVLALEFLGSFLGDAPASDYPGWLVPIAWPTPVRVLWWLMGSAGAFATSRGLDHVTGRRRLLRGLLVASPFVIFAIGIATGAEWATWH